MLTAMRLLGIMAVVLGFASVTSLTASAVETGFTVTVLDCTTDDPNVQPGQVDFLFGPTAAAEVDCVTTTFGEDGTALTLYTAGDLTTPLDTGAVAGGEGSGDLSADFEGEQSFQIGVGADDDEVVSGEFTATGGAETLAYAIRYQAAPPVEGEGDIEVFKYECVDDQRVGEVDFAVADIDPTCDLGNGYLIGLEDGQGDPVGEPQPTVGGFVAFTGLSAGTYVLTENGLSSAPIAFQGATIEVNVVNYVASEPVDGAVELTNLTCVGDDPGTSIFAAPPGEAIFQPVATLECVLAPESFLVYAFGDTNSQPIALEADGSGFGSVALPPGTHLIEEPDSGASESFTIAAGATTQILVETVAQPAPTTGSVVIGAYTCIGVQAGVEIEVSEPTFSADAVDLTDCVPLNELSFSIYPFGDEQAAPITGTTDDDGNGDGTVLLTELPSTNGTDPHLFRTVVFDSDFEAFFDVEVDALTAITVIVFEPAPPTATATATPTQPIAPTGPATHPPTATAPTAGGTATVAATGTVSTLPSTGAGGGFGAGGGGAWLLGGALALAALGSAGYAARRRAG